MFLTKYKIPALVISGLGLVNLGLEVYFNQQYPKTANPPTVPDKGVSPMRAQPQKERYIRIR